MLYSIMHQFMMKMAADREWLTQPDEYICNLSEETQLIAKNELGEDEYVRNQALASMRHWITHNPRIVNCRLDSNYLLRFLRFAKFSVVEAQIILERLLLLRQTYAYGFQNLDVRIPAMQEILDVGCVCICPQRDKKGRRVIILRGGPFDVKRFSKAEVMRMAAIVFETIIENEEDQIRGFVYIGDGLGVGLSYLTLCTPLEFVRLVKNGEKTIPARHMEVYGINVNPAFKALVQFGLSLTSEKIRKRIKVYSNLEDFVISGDVDVSILPKEYGGTIPMSDMIALLKEELKQSNSLLLPYDQMKVREEMFSIKEREGRVSALNGDSERFGNEDDYLTGLPGSFRKLEVD